MTLRVDALQSHPDDVANIANRARNAGASKAEIQETPALVTAMNAFKKS
jgi:hypothetical protein